MQDWKGFAARAKGFVTGQKHAKWLLLLGLAGIVLIFLSEAIPDKAASSAPGAQEDMAAYTKALEQKLTQMCEEIDGTGKVLVTVTLESSRESVFAGDSTQSGETREETGAEKTLFQQTQEKEETILLSGGAPLIQTYREPKVSGVVVVCEGGDDVSVRTKVTMAVATVLGVSSNRVYVTR